MERRDSELSGAGSEAGDHPRTEVLWTRRRGGRVGFNTSCPSVVSRGFQGDGAEPLPTPPQPRRDRVIVTTQDEDDLAWVSLLTLEGFMRQDEEDRVETFWEALLRHGDAIADDPETRDQRLPGLITALQSPNGFGQRSTERIIRMVQGASYVLEDEATLLEENLQRAERYIKFMKACYVVACFVLMLSFFL